MAARTPLNANDLDAQDSENQAQLARADTSKQSALERQSLQSSLQTKENELLAQLEAAREAQQAAQQRLNRAQQMVTQSYTSAEANKAALLEKTDVVRRETSERKSKLRNGTIQREKLVVEVERYKRQLTKLEKKIKRLEESSKRSWTGMAVASGWKSSGPTRMSEAVRRAHAQLSGSDSDDDMTSPRDESDGSETEATGSHGSHGRARASTGIGGALRMRVERGGTLGGGSSFDSLTSVASVAAARRRMPVTLARDRMKMRAARGSLRQQWTGSSVR